MICLGPDFKVKTAQMLDLYEGSARDGLAIPTSSVPHDTQVSTAMAKLKAYDKFVGYDVENALQVVTSKIAYLPAGEIMAPGVDLGDSYAAIIPDGCEIAYAGYYESDGTLRISQDIFDKFTETDKAALFMHEAIYKSARDIGGETNSLHTREVNAYLFAPSGQLKAIPDVVADISWGGLIQNNSDPSNPIKQLPDVAVPLMPSTYTIVVTEKDSSAAVWSTPATVACFDVQGHYHEYNVDNGNTSNATYPRQVTLTFKNDQNCEGFRIELDGNAPGETTGGIAADLYADHRKIVSVSSSPTQQDFIFGVYSGI